MGDTDKFRYPLKMAQCAVCKNEYNAISLRECRHPAVKKHFGTSDKVLVCYLECHKCKYNRKYQYTSVLGCDYKEEGGDGT